MCSSPGFRVGASLPTRLEFKILRLVALASAAASAGGCADAAPETSTVYEAPSEPDVVPLICSETGGPSFVEGLKPAPAVDYVAFRRVVEGQAPSALEVDGVACDSAKSSEACEAALAALQPVTTWPYGTLERRYFAYTRGDEVGSIGSDEELLAFLGSIDTPNEAALVLWSLDRPVNCGHLVRTAEGFAVMQNQTIGPSGGCSKQVMVEVVVQRDGSITENEVGQGSWVCVGRRPDGLLQTAGSEPRRGAGAYFAHVAGLELAAVAAFAELSHWLVAHGAPSQLVERCRVAGRDELRHTALMSELARSCGAEPEPVRFLPSRARTLLELALENAREGTSRELFGAAVAAWQARFASSPDVRARFAEIARDEAQHAELSLELASWLAVRLSEQERVLVARERERAFAELDRELASEVSDEVVAVAGVPAAANARRLLAELRAELA